jgi:LuxR family maltose regulon positive regulatory protein
MEPGSQQRLATEGGPEFIMGKVPGFDARFVRRRRLTRQLLRSSPARLVLLTAPAGYSKTTCLTEWADTDARPFAWINASPRHDDPALLAASIVEAIDQIEPVHPDVLAALVAPQPGVSSALIPRLGDSLEGSRRPFVLVIDDVHLLSSPAAFELLEGVIGVLPQGSQLALASRAEGLLQVGRLRAHHQLAELTQRDLAMTGEESGELLTSLGLELTSSQVEVLFEHTEGWPAALYLAGLCLLDQPDLAVALESFAGDDRIVVDYLRDEFLSAIGPKLLSFLTRTALLDELSGPLCDALLERADSGRVLRDLVRSNYLVIPLDRVDGRYRYHHLFREMLESELRRREPELEAELHRRASRWYAEHSEADRAIDHAIAAEEIDRAGELIWAVFPELATRGRIATLERWLDEIGDDRIASSTRLMLASGHRYLALGQGERAVHWMRAVEASGEGDESVEGDLRLLSATAAIEGVVQMGKDAARASELLPPDVAWQSPAFLYGGVSSQLTGHPRRAVPLLKEATRRGAVAAPIIQAIALAQLALIAIDDDDWELGSRLISQARDQVQRCGLSGYPSVSITLAVSALIRARQGQVDQAEQDMTAATQLLGGLSDFPPWYETEIRIVLARACVRLDDAPRASGLLKEASRFLELTPDAAILSCWIDDAAAEVAADTAHAGRDSLTKAELRTLQYLPSHLSFREIGDRIHVSANTVKTQAQAIYRKLDASSRGEAVERARSAGLVGDQPRV